MGSVLTGQWSPDRTAGQPEGDADRLALLDRLLAERFPRPHRATRVDLTRPDVVPLWDGHTTG